MSYQEQQKQNGKHFLDHTGANQIYFSWNLTFKHNDLVEESTSDHLWKKEASRREFTHFSKYGRSVSAKTHTFY